MKRVKDKLKQNTRGQKWLINSSMYMPLEETVDTTQYKANNVHVCEPVTANANYPIENVNSISCFNQLICCN